ncbi:apolipoprotein N-acyltransferase [Poseidonocella pacifica]|uniref:Apolipoprotein N-acyltransferase n=1 Tax=Poseidonocella pacifica TaxID=871651 RepID=A0A1I0WE76_9RHOB|nr:apolipoprotein N-acyltransferase [Poseidonocella pacifica]SFA86884.1 apolipoprotein N-acyltransferase [Poseidonocella pacifica]
MAAGAGLVAGLSQAPFDLPPLGLLGFSAAIWLWYRATSVREATLLGLCTGIGYFALVLFWIVEPFFVDVARHGWMAPFALVLMSGGMALFWGAAFGAARLAGGGWAIVPFWALLELARAYIFTGFPWAMPAQALIDGQAGQLLAWVGPHGANILLFAVAALPAFFGRRGGLAVAAVSALSLVSLPAPEPSTGPILRLVQPNAAQHEKWDPALTERFLQRKLDYTAAMPRPDLIVWPETSVPYLMEYAEPIFARIAEAANGTPVVVGVMRMEKGKLYNSLRVVGGGPSAPLYDKHHLVPFGEYVPFAELAARMGIFGLATDRLGGYSPGPGPRLIDIEGIGAALPLICYEAVFPQHARTEGGRPRLLLQITNDAWFGSFSGPYQHLAQARMRAIEQGLPLARAANTGVSALIDGRGRIRGAIPLNEAGYVDLPLPDVRPPTLYSRTGDGPYGVLLFIMCGTVVLRSRRLQR